MNRVLATKIADCIRPVVEVLGFELWGCELRGQGGRMVLSVYIDKDSGVTLADCLKANSQIGGMLDVEDLIVNSYVLEISSPGLDRTLFTADHFARFVGRKIRVKLMDAVDGRHNYLGTIKEVVNNKVVIVVEDDELKFNIDDIDKAKLIPEF